MARRHMSRPARKRRDWTSQGTNLTTVADLVVTGIDIALTPGAAAVGYTVARIVGSIFLEPTVFSEGGILSMGVCVVPELAGTALSPSPVDVNNLAAPYWLWTRTTFYQGGSLGQTQVSWDPGHQLVDIKVMRRVEADEHLRLMLVSSGFSTGYTFGTRLRTLLLK